MDFGSLGEQLFHLWRTVAPPQLIFTKEKCLFTFLYCWIHNCVEQYCKNNVNPRSLYSFCVTYYKCVITQICWLIVFECCLVGRGKHVSAVSHHGKSLVKSCTLRRVNENFAITTKWTRCVLKWFICCYADCYAKILPVVLHDLLTLAVYLRCQKFLFGFL